MPQKKTAILWPDSATILERSRGVLFAQWEELLRLRLAAIKSFNLDDIHDLRVASRRFRAALELFYTFAPKDSKAELRKNVRKLTQMLGGLRNIDEALLFFQSRTDGSVEFKICHTFSKLRVTELKKIEKALATFDHRNLDRMVRRVVAALREDSNAKLNNVSLLAYFSDVSIRKYLPIHQLLAVSTKPESCEQRHALRIATKKWRYFFEIIGQILDRDYKSHLELLREYQTILGRMNDITEFRLLLNNLELPGNEREHVELIFQKEDNLLLENFIGLIEKKPLIYSFSI